VSHPDPQFMQAAIAQSLAGVRQKFGGPFGAVIVRDGEVIASGHNEVTSSNDPTAHAEILAIRRACKKLETFHLKGCVLYTSCEPCPMCLAAIYWAQLDRIYFGCDQHVAASSGFSDEFLYVELKKPLSDRAIPTEQFMPDESRAAFDEWNAMEDKTPY